MKTDFKFIVINNNTQWSVFAILGRAFQPHLKWRVDSRKRGEEDFLKERILNLRRDEPSNTQGRSEGKHHSRRQGLLEAESLAWWQRSASPRHGRLGTWVRIKWFTNRSHGDALRHPHQRMTKQLPHSVFLSLWSPLFFD